MSLRSAQALATEKGYRLYEFCSSSKPIKAYSYLGRKGRDEWVRVRDRELTTLPHPKGWLPPLTTSVLQRDSAVVLLGCF